MQEKKHGPKCFMYKAVFMNAVSRTYTVYGAAFLTQIFMNNTALIFIKERVFPFCFSPFVVALFGPGLSVPSANNWRVQPGAKEKGNMTLLVYTDQTCRLAFLFLPFIHHATS